MTIKYGLAALLSLFILTACNPETEEAAEEPETIEEEPTNQMQSIIPRDFTLNELSIEADSDEIEIHYINDEWVSSGLDDSHSPSISQFIDDLFLLRGMPSEDEPDEESDLTVTLANDEKSIDLVIWHNKNYSLIESEGNYFEVDEWPLTLDPFDPIFLEEPLNFGLGTLQELVFDNTQEKYKLNQETTMNEVERIPFVSGWYVHGDFNTPFSAEYYWLEDLFTSIYSLRGYPTEESLGESTQTLTLNDGESQEQVIIGKQVDDTFTLVNVKNQNYRVPSQLLNRYDVELLSIVDNFVALIPLDAVQTVDILTDEEDIHISVDRLIESGEVKSTFYVNDEEIEEEIFRRTYQYLARLAYSERIEESDMFQINPEDSEVTIHYTYMVDGREVEKSIYLVPEESSGDYFVINGDIIEFKMTNERLEEMLNAFSSL